MKKGYILTRLLRSVISVLIIMFVVNWRLTLISMSIMP